MFETANLSSGPSTKRVWATCAGFTGQTLLIAFALMAPMIWPHSIPQCPSRCHPLVFSLRGHSAS